MRRVTFVAVVLVAALVSAAPGLASEIDPRTEKEVKGFLDSQTQAYGKKDLKAVMAMLAPDADVVMLGNGPDDRWVGPDQIKKAYESFLAQYKSEIMRLTWTSIRAKGNVAWFAARCVIHQMKQPEGKETLLINWTGVLEKRKDKWLLVQSHFSFPIAKGK